MVTSNSIPRGSSTRWGAFACLALMLVCCLLSLFSGPGAALHAQDADEAGPVAAPVADAAPGDEGEIPATTAPPKQARLSLFWLLWQGGWMMVPIVIMSLVLGTFGLERALGLRRSKIMPGELIDSLGRLAGAPGGFDPRKAYRLCQEYPSSAATVIRAMLLKVGRPHSEVEHAVAEASEREAARLYANVRWLTLTSAVTPLMGLLGTVWGMILAFYNTANLPAGTNKADALAEGIYVALVTTLAGLAVAIPAAILAHMFEGRIQSLFHQIDELLFSLLPQIERYEGRLRVNHQSLGEGISAGEAAPPTDPAARGKGRPAAAPASAPAPATK